MGQSLTNPYAYRRAIAELHYKEHKLSGDALNSNKKKDGNTATDGRSDEDMTLFWRTLFCTHLSDEEHASFWTAEDVRLLRLYHPDRLALILSAAMKQLELFYFLCGDKEDDEDLMVNLDDEDEMGGGGVGYMQLNRSSGKRKDSYESTKPLDCTSAVNALRLISGALPYCFEDIRELKSLLYKYEKSAAEDETDIVITSQHTRDLMRTDSRKESPFAADFAYHFFVRGRACLSNTDTADSVDSDSGGSSEDMGSAAFSLSSKLPLGTRLVGLLVKLFFLPGFTVVDGPQHPERTVCTEESLAVDLALLTQLDSQVLPFSPTSVTATPHTSSLPDMTSSPHGSTLSSMGTTLHRKDVTPSGEKHRALLLRTIVLALSGPIFERSTESTNVPVAHKDKTDDGVESTPSRQRWEETTAVMANGLLDGRGQSFSALLCVSLLHVVRCYPKRPLTSALHRSLWKGSNCLTSTHITVLGHALTLLAMGIYNGLSPVCRPASQKELTEAETNVFLQVLNAALGFHGADVGTTDAAASFCTQSSSGSMQGRENADPDTVSCLLLPSQNPHGGNKREGSRIISGDDNASVSPFNYVQNLVESLLLLLEGPLTASQLHTPGAAIPCAPLAFHLLFWLLQHNPVAVEMVGGGPRPFMMLLHSLLVSGTVSSSRFGDGQMALLCLLILLRHPPFLRLLTTPLPSLESGATVEETNKFLSTLKAAMPMLPEKLVILGNGNSNGEKNINDGNDNSLMLSIRTYADVLVLSLCYVLSPSAPRWYQALHRTATEVLYTLQVCLTHTPLPRVSFSTATTTTAGLCTEPHFLHQILSEDVMLELANSFNYLASCRVLRRGVGAERVCLQMISALLHIIRPYIISTQGERDVSQFSTECVGQQDGGTIVPLLCTLAMRDDVFTLMHLVQLTCRDHIENGLCVAEQGDANETEKEESLFGENNPPEFVWVCEERNSRKKSCGQDFTTTGTTTTTGDRATSRTGTSPYELVLLQLASSRELPLLYQMAVAVRKQVNRMGGASPITAANSLPTSELVEPVGWGEASNRYETRRGESWMVVRAAAEVLRKEAAEEETKRREGVSGEGTLADIKKGGGSVEVIPKVVVGRNRAALRWLFGHLWRQVHMFNLAPPMFDYWSATLLRM